MIKRVLFELVGRLFRCRAQRCCWLVICILLIGETSFAQEPLMSSFAGKRLAQAVDCVNQDSAEERLQFLKSAFEDQDELENRIQIAAQLHRQFAPLTLHKAITVKPFEVVAEYKTESGDRLLWTLDVKQDAPHRIVNIEMEPVEDNRETALPQGMYPLVRNDGSTDPRARGVWKANGYGYVFEVTERECRVYNVTNKYGWQQEFDESLIFAPDTSADKIKFTFHPLEPGYNMVRLKKIPVRCLEAGSWSQTKLFFAFCDLFETHYPFFKARKFDWAKRLEVVKPRVNDEMTDEELFQAMSSMVDGLDDGHVSLEAKIDGDTQMATTGGEDTMSRLRASFKPTEEVKTRSLYFRNWLNQMKQELLQDVLAGSGEVVANEQIIWGRPAPRVGYIFIGGMGGYSLGGIDSQVHVLHQELNRILGELAETDALIIDISFNGGGSDLFSLEIASHFADKKRVGFSKWPASHPEYRNDRYVVPYNETNSKGVMYTKPIYLVTNDISASAAEIFTMCMRAMPHVKTFGLSTEGALSDVLGKTLPNGWELGLSNEIYVDHKGICHEGPGVPPDVKMDIFDRGDITQIGHAESIKRIVKMAVGEADKN